MAVFGLGGKKDEADADGRGKLQFDPLQTARALPWLIALLVALGLWCLVAGGLRQRDDSREHALEFARRNHFFVAGEPVRFSARVVSRDPTLRKEMLHGLFQLENVFGEPVGRPVPAQFRRARPLPRSSGPPWFRSSLPTLWPRSSRGWPTGATTSKSAWETTWLSSNACSACRNDWKPSCYYYQ